MKNRSFTKKEICDRIFSQHGGYSLKEVQSTVEAILNTMKQGVEEDSKLLISGFGTFFQKEVKQRQVTLPNGEKIQSQERTRIWFKPARALKDRMNQGSLKTSDLEQKDA